MSNENMSLITAVIILNNKAYHVVHAPGSLRGWTFADFQLIVVNNTSSDRSEAEYNNTTL